jgi:hypothetical protein
LAIRRAQRFARLTRALSVAMPVFAYSLVHGLQSATGRVLEHQGPGHIAVPFHDGVRTAETLRLVGIERRERHLT